MLARYDRNRQEIKKRTESEEARELMETLDLPSPPKRKHTSTETISTHGPIGTMSSPVRVSHESATCTDGQEDAAFLTSPIRDVDSGEDDVGVAEESSLWYEDRVMVPESHVQFATSGGQSADVEHRSKVGDDVQPCISHTEHQIRQRPAGTYGLGAGDREGHAADEKNCSQRSGRNPVSDLETVQKSNNGGTISETRIILEKPSSSKGKNKKNEKSEAPEKSARKLIASETQSPEGTEPPYFGVEEDGLQHLSPSDQYGKLK